MEIAAKRIVWGKFLNAGQTCIAPDYLLVEEEIKAPLLDLIKEYLDEFQYEEGAEHYVNVINKRNFERIMALIDSAKVYYGGSVDEGKRFIQPTVLDNVTWDDSVMQDEIFGPVLPVLCFKGFGQILSKIVTLDKPLSAYLFTDDEEEKALFLREISFGGVVSIIRLCT